MTRKLESPFVHLLLLVGAIAMLMPFAWMVSTSLKAQNEVFSYPPQWIPSQLLWSNYAQAWAAAPFGRYFINSGIVALAVTFLDLVTSSLAAFAFGRMQFPLRNALFTLYLASMMIPHQMTIIPAFLLLKNFGEISPAQCWHAVRAAQLAAGGKLDRAAEKFLNRVQVCTLAESLGGVESLISHPATMTHGAIPAAEREKLGITEGLVRLSVGCEDTEDLIADLDRALGA